MIRGVSRLFGTYRRHWQAMGSPPRRGRFYSFDRRYLDAMVNYQLDKRAPSAPFSSAA